MSRLLNPLDKFSSYSTHFLMVACRTTEYARKFANEAALTSTLQALNSVKQLGDAVIVDGSANDVFLVMDTRRFSQYSVEKMNYEVFINGLQTNAGHGNLATEIKMTILDSVGISFINFLQWLMDTKMQCNFDGMIFMIRVIFVGHNANGTTETVQTVTIPCHLFKLDVNLDYAKGVYECIFMPNFNFAVHRHNRWTHIGNATSYVSSPDTKGDNSLGAMIDSFEKRLNRESEEFYNEISVKLLEAQGSPVSTKPGFGRRVRYQITIDEKWRDYQMTGSSAGADVEKNFKEQLAQAQEQAAAAAKAAGSDVSKHVKNTYVSVEPSQTITQVLDIIFGQVNEIKELANNDKKAGPGKYLTFYKHLVSISSNDDYFVVHVDVIPFEIPRASPPKNTQQQSVSQFEERFFTTDDRGIKRPINFFELDFIFTGKNVDILSLDLKIQDLQMLLASNVRVGAGELFGQVNKGQAERGSGDGDGVKKLSIWSARQYDPIMIPMLTSEQRKNLSHNVVARSKEDQSILRANSQEYTENLSAWYTKSPIMISTVIKGNPFIMQKFNLGAPVSHTIAAEPSSSLATDKTKYRKHLEEEILKLDGVTRSRTNSGAFSVDNPLGNQSYVAGPVFAKVNIKGPNVDPRTNQQVNGEEFAKEVLNNNYYRVMKVINNIERGVFTQEIEMYAHNVYGDGSLHDSNRESKNPNEAPQSIKP